MRKKTKHNTLSTSAPTAGSTASSAQQQAFLTPWSYHNLPLNKFIDSIEIGLPDETIYNQFFEAIKDKQQRYISKLIRDINLMQTKHNVVKTAVVYFRIAAKIGMTEFDADIIAILKQHINIRPGDNADIILARAGKFLTDLELKKHELNRLSPPAGDEGAKVDRSFFTHLLIQVGKHMKYYIDKASVTVAEFADMINDMREEQEQLRSQINGNRYARKR